MASFYDYDSIEDKQARASRIIKKLSKKQALSPLVYQKPSVKDYWAYKWEQNIKQYADFSNRIARGRSYVKNGFVIDFKLSEGLISGLVVGSSTKPYEVEIKIKPLEKKKLDSLFKLDKVKSLESLMLGKFDEELTNKLIEIGLFPKPSEIKFSCSCPDRAYMCKHVAAVLFGVASKLVEEPLLIFTLRGIDVNLLIKESTDKIIDSMLKNAKKKPKRALSEEERIRIFEV